MVDERSLHPGCRFQGSCHIMNYKEAAGMTEQFVMIRIYLFIKNPLLLKE